MNTKTTPHRSGVCVFTIVSRNYLHFARTLMQSVAEHAADVDRYVCLCDQPGDADFSCEPFRVIGLDELRLPDPQAFIFQYTVIELNTAVKPYAFQWLFERHGYEKVIYFDPDIRLYHGLADMIGLLDAHPVILTPHLTEPLDDDRHPSDHSILQSGAYNLGYLGLRRGAAAERLLGWWQGKTSRDCVVDVANGFFVDQKWMDLVPGFFEGTLINRDPGWNVAYWNLKHRKITHDGTVYRVNGKPLVFFRYSGIALDGKTFSRYQDRYTMETLGPEVRQLVRGYLEELRANGGGKAAGARYAYGEFPDGTPIPDIARILFREQRDQFGNLEMFSFAGVRGFVDYANSPAEYRGGRRDLRLGNAACSSYLCAETGSEGCISGCIRGGRPALCALVRRECLDAGADRRGIPRTCETGARGWRRACGRGGDKRAGTDGRSRWGRPASLAVLSRAPSPGRSGTLGVAKFAFLRCPAQTASLVARRQLTVR